MTDHNREQQNDEFLCLESLLSPDEFQKTGINSGIMEIAVFIEQGYEAVVVDSVDKMQHLDEWISQGESSGEEQRSKHLDEIFGDLHASLQHLPPIRVTFTLPEYYPSEEPPNVNISSTWIPRRLIAGLESQVKVLWEQNGRQAVLYELFQFMTDRATSGTLFGPSTWCLPVFCRDRLCLPVNALGMLESRNLLVVSNAHKMLKSLENYNENRILVLFQQGSHRCNICFESYPGTNFIRLTNCKHFICKACMKGLCDSMIKEGAMAKLQCMECQADLNPFDVEVSVDPDVWAKYQKFQLEHALSTMEDVVYCPRPWCNQAVLKEGDSSAGRCPGCSYVFCIHCRRGYHGVEPCPLNGEKRVVVDAYRNASPQEKTQMEKRYGLMRLRNLVDEVKAEDWVSQNAKQCPKCKFPVQKLGGCNKMVCTKCGSPFCWICNAKLTMADPYDHFRDSSNKECFMNLMLGIQNDEENVDHGAIDFEDEEDIFEEEDLQGRWFGAAFGADGRLMLRELRQVLQAAAAFRDRLG